MSIDRAKALKSAQKHLAKGQIDRAIADYEKLVAADPSDARSLLKLGDIYTRKGDTRGATATYRKVALQYAAQGFFLKAVAVFKQILKLDPQNLGALESLAEMYEKLSLASDALATFEQVADGHIRSGKPEKALSALGKVSELDPENVAAFIRYAEALSKANRIDEAAEAFRRGADLLKRQHRMDDYIKVSERLLFHSHEDLDRARELSALYIERQQAKAALSHLQTCFKADPRDLQTLELLARAFAQLGQSVKAVSVYKEIARIHAEAGRAAEEQAALAAVLELDPSDTESHERAQSLSLGPREDSQIYELIDEDDELEEVVIVDDRDSAATRTLETAPVDELDRETHVSRLLAECDVFLRYGLRDKVVAQLERVIELDPNHVEARHKLKDAHLRRGDVLAAVAHLRKLAELEAERDRGKARAYIEEALRLSPEDSAVQALLASLAQGELDAAPEAGQADEPESDELIILDSDDAEEAAGDDAGSGPVASPSVPGPREISLATALEGTDEPELIFEEGDDDEEDEDSEIEVEYADAGDDDDLVLVDDSEPIAQEAPEPPSPSGLEQDDVPTAEHPHFGAAESELGAPGVLAEAVSEALEEADFYLAQGLQSEAREVLEEALAGHPDEPALLRKLAGLAGSQPPARDAEQEAREDHSFALAQKLAEEAGGSAQGRLDMQQVLEQFRAGVRSQVDRSDTATHYDLGIAYMEMGLHAEAIEEFKLCLDAPDKECTAHTMIGLSYVASGEMQSGIEHFKRALASPTCKAGEELDLWFEIGNASELLGRASEALVWYEKVEERQPDFRDVAARIERLGTEKTPEEEVDEFDAMFDNMILKE